MLEALALDLLLFLILLLLIPIGMYRGGLREICSAAGVLLGVLVSREWSLRWGTWVAGRTGIDEDVSSFVVAVGTMVVFAALIGYGAAAGFSYRPGPGGRLYGGLLALASGVVFLGAVVQYVATYLYEGIYPDLIRDGYLSRALSVGFDWVLLAVAIGVTVATVFAMVVRERETEEFVYEAPAPAPRRSGSAPAMAPEPIVLAPQEHQSSGQEPVEATAAIRIKEVRHWEEPTPPTIHDIRSGWSRTWPSDVNPTERKPRWSGPGASPGRPRQPARAAVPRNEDVIRDWLSEDQATRRNRPPGRKPGSDE